MKPPIPERKKLNLSSTTRFNDKIPENTPKNYIDRWSFVTPQENTGFQ